MNAKFKSILSGIIAVSFASIISFGCSNPSVSNDPYAGKIFDKVKLYDSSKITVDNGSKTFNDISAATVVARMKSGWNLGNTLDAINGDEKTGRKDQPNNQGLSSETSWGQPETTEEMIKTIADSGIKTIRIPTSWSAHIIDDKYTIDPQWMDRVKTIVDWAIKYNMYVILNVHHDNVGAGTLTYGKGYCPNEADMDESQRFLYNVWSQIAATFNNSYDEHLIFETINEPRLPGDQHEWGWNANCETCKNSMYIINKYNQLCLDAIRETGGNNTKRIVMVPSYVASPNAAWDAYSTGIFKFPTDPSGTGKIALSVHMYSPYNFAMESPGSTIFTEAHKNDLAGMFSRLKNDFISKGYPVVVGEMGATNKNNLSERESWFQFFAEKAKEYNCSIVLWDNGNYEVSGSDYSEHFGYFNRNNYTWYFPSLITTMVNAIGESSDPTSKTIWTGTKDLKHWNGEDGITLDSSNFSTATDSTKIRFTISIGAECTAIDNGSPCTNNYSTIHPITAWPDENNDGNITFPEANTNHQLSVSPTASASTVTISPDSTSWTTIKSKGLIIYGHKVVITKIELL